MVQKRSGMLGDDGTVMLEHCVATLGDDEVRWCENARVMLRTMNCECTGGYGVQFDFSRYRIASRRSINNSAIVHLIPCQKSPLGVI